jgi:hypothetical protein
MRSRLLHQACGIPKREQMPASGSMCSLAPGSLGRRNAQYRLARWRPVAGARLALALDLREIEVQRTAIKAHLVDEDAHPLPQRVAGRLAEAQFAHLALLPARWASKVDPLVAMRNAE